MFLSGVLRICEDFDKITQLTHHVYSTLKRRGNDCFHVVSMWNTCGVFVVNNAKMLSLAITCGIYIVIEIFNI